MSNLASPSITAWHRASANLYTSITSTGEVVALAKCGRFWRLLLDGEEVAHIGRRASFDHAEGIILNLLNKH